MLRGHYIVSLYNSGSGSQYKQSTIYRNFLLLHFSLLSIIFQQGQKQKIFPILPILLKYVLGIGWYKVDAIKMPKIGAGGDIPRPLARGEQVSGEIQHDYSF